MMSNTLLPFGQRLCLALAFALACASPLCAQNPLGLFSLPGDAASDSERTSAQLAQELTRLINERLKHSAELRENREELREIDETGREEDSDGSPITDEELGENEENREAIRKEIIEDTNEITEEVVEEYEDDQWVRGSDVLSWIVWLTLWRLGRRRRTP